MDVIIHNEMKVLDSIMPKWINLRKNFYEVTVFQDISWIKSWWEVKNKQSQFSPYIVEIRDKIKTVGIIPLFCSVKKIGGINFRILKPIGVGQSDYIVPIFSKEYSPEFLVKLAIEKIYRDKSNWDFIEWADIPEDSIFDSILIKNYLRSYTFVERLRTHNCPCISIEPDFEELKHNFSKKFLKGILKNEKKLNENGVLTINKVDKEEEIEPMMNKFFELHCDRWRNTDNPSIFENTAERELALLAAKNFYKSNLLNLICVSQNEEIIVIHFGMVDGEKSYLYQHAINKKYQKYSPGSLIVYYLVLEACKERYKYVDFLRGDEGYKQKWGTKDKFNVKYVFFNSSIKSLIFRTIYRVYNLKYLKLYDRKIVKKQLHSGLLKSGI